MESNPQNADRVLPGAPVEQVEDEAAAWLLRRESPQWSPADEAQLERWLKASAGHRVAFMRLRSVWRETGRLRVVVGLAPGQVPPRGTIGRTPFFARKGRGTVPGPAATNIDGRGSAMSGGRSVPSGAIPARRYLIAAGIPLAATLGLGAVLWSHGAPSYRTPIGGLATVPMDDGSKITLNTNTRITLAVTDKERRVDLTRGEAFFEVARDPLRPFVVYANDQRVVAVGTKFSVRLKPESLQVAVTEGQVRLEKKTSLLGAPGPLPAGGGPPLLTPGIVANVKDGAVSVERLSPADVDLNLSWRSGNVVLRKASLADAVNEFNRYNRRQLVIADAALSDIKVGGNFRADNISGFVRLLQQGFRIDAAESGERIVLTRRSGTE